ncbi:MAG TPA: hypothetical protein VFO34_11445 [Candidatus Acidoferrales bacterium]|nr:hypothetical protein [Candidatus Acidoferrales bacterium]
MRHIVHNRSSIVKRNVYPLKHVLPSRFPRLPRRLTYEGVNVTVCIAAICNNGENIVCAVDGMLSDTHSSISGDVAANKIVFLDDWALMLSGSLSNADLILEELRLAPEIGEEKLTRANIRDGLAKAYKRQLSKLVSERTLSVYDMDMDEFKKEGRKYFGDERFAELSRIMEQDASTFQDSILVAGWGAAEASANIFGVDAAGFASHTLNGFAAIGSGGMVAMSTLLQLWRGRHMTTEDALYAVASAKFASETCMGVGEGTTMSLLRKRREADDKDAPVARLLQPEHVKQLRKLWKKHGRPQIPESAITVLHQIAADIEAPSGTGFIRALKRARMSRGKK